RLPRLVARLLHALCDHLHRLLERDELPFRPARPAVEAVVDAMAAGDELEAGRSFRAQTAAGDGRILVAFDVEDAAVLDEDLLAAADGAVGTDALHHR